MKEGLHIELEAIYKEFDTRLGRFIHGKVSNPADVDDILQNVYLKIHNSINGLRDDEKIESWIFQITRNAIIDYYRRSRPEEELTEHIRSKDKDQVEAVTELASSVYGMLNCLPDKYRQALTMTEIQGLSQVELAEEMGISVSGAKSRVQRAREKLKEAFLDCCHFEFDRFGKVIEYAPKCDHCKNNQLPGCNDCDSM